MEAQILKELENSRTIEQTIEIYFPGWFILSLEKYSSDYPHLQKNWEYLCGEMKTTPKKIVLVNEIVLGQEPTTINKICEFMTKNGYVVRRSGEFIACSVCEKAIPCIEIWGILKEKGFPVPKTWGNTCSTCLHS